MQMTSQRRDALKGNVERSERFAAIIAGQNTKIITQAINETVEIPHGAFTHVDMQITDVKDCEAIKQWRQFFESDLVVCEANTFSIPTPAPIKTGINFNAVRMKE